MISHYPTPVRHLTVSGQALDSLLRQPLDDNLLTAPHRRRTLLKLLGQARSCTGMDGQGSELQSYLNLEYFVLPGSSAEYGYHSPDTIWDWMKQHRINRSKSTCTFLFPKIHAGPDLLFILEATSDQAKKRQHNWNPTKILCALQVKKFAFCNPKSYPMYLC